jgi:hypothetical protein
MLGCANDVTDMGTTANTTGGAAVPAKSELRPARNWVPPNIGPFGGHVDGPNGASVDIPAGALAGPVHIRIGAPSSGYPTLPSNKAPLGAVFAFEPHGQQFSSDVTITVPYSGGSSAVRVLSAEPGGAWSDMAGPIAIDGTARVKSSHFSYMVVMPPASACSVGNKCTLHGDCGAHEMCVDASFCACAPGLTACGKCCADLGIDPQNCGACGLACQAAQGCKLGLCQ